MLKRIKTIKNVGTLAEVHAAQCGFSKFTLIYGGNSYGKSTLCDVFTSLRDDNNIAIEKRKTVNSTDAPLVSLSFSDADHEMEVLYKNLHWERSRFCESLEIFDADFVHRNVFTNNSEIDQNNRVNLTEFIIGEDAIVAATALQKLNEEKNDIDRARKIVEEKVLKSGFEVGDLLKITYKEDVKAEDTLCLSLKQNIADQKKNEDNLDAIKNLPLPHPFTQIPDNYGEYERINRILASEFSFEADNLLEKFIEHKTKHLSTEKDADDWLQKGKEYSKNEACPFCGQPIVDNELVASYFIIFSDEFKAYNEAVKTLKLQKLDSGCLDKIQLQSEQNRQMMESICSKILNTELTNLKEEVISSSGELLKIAIEHVNILKKLHGQFESQIEKKLLDKYASAPIVSLDYVFESYNKLKTAFTTANEKVEKFCELAQNELSNLSVSSIDEKIREMDIELAKLDRIVSRNKYNDEIEEYKRLEAARQSNRAEEKRQKEEFDRQQKTFLDSFFKDIEAYFSMLGSRNYSIEKEETSKGIKKTYSLKLSYKGKAVPSSDIKYVLSESDKRALALSIFLSKLKRSKSPNTIVILDDPISSFDIDRMQAFTNTLKEFYNDVSQIIILTHYKNFYKILAGWSSRYLSDMSLLKIVNASNSNGFISINKEEDKLLMDEFQESLFDMVSFINGNAQVYNEVSARVFMEKFIEYYFMLEIKERSLQYTSLDTLLQALRDSGLIDRDLYTKLDIKREEYNSPAHEFDCATIDAKRSSLRELYNLLHAI